MGQRPKTINNNNPKVIPLKLIIAIVNNDDAHAVNSSLSRAGFYVPKLASTGGFLMTGNSTLRMGVEDGDIDRAVEVIKNNSKKRVQNIPSDMTRRDAGGAQPARTVTVGGATVFVLNIEECRRL